ncbi:MAG: ABC transporter ATP-binding protein [Polyangiales bacterium]
MASTVMRSEQSTPAASLVVGDLCVRRAGRTVLDRVSFSLAPGEIAIVVGPNGAGKTTLIEAVIGAQRPSAGRVTYGAHELRDLAGRALVFSYLSDAAEPPAELQVSVFMCQAVRVGRVPADRAEELVQRLGLLAFASARIGSLSRGQKRRLALFGALCSDRPVVVLDEPLGTFDPLQARGVLELLRAQARLGASLLLSVHQLADAEKLEGRVLILDQGRLVAAGTLEELRARASMPRASLEQVFLTLLEQRHARS